MVKDNPTVPESTSQLNGSSLSPIHSLLDTNNPSDSNSDAISQQPQQPSCDRRPHFKLQNRPAQLIRNLHASYFNHHFAEISSPGATDSAVAEVLYSIRSNVFAFGAVASFAGCAILLGLGHSKHNWRSIGNFGLIIQLTYHGLFVATCSWQWFKRLTRSSSTTTKKSTASSSSAKSYADGKNRFDGTGGDNENPTNDPRATESIHVLDSSLEDPNIAFVESPTTPQPVNNNIIVAPAPLPYWIIGYGVLGFLASTPILTSLSWNSSFWSPILALASFSPLIVGPCLLGLDKISNALSKDQLRFNNELDDLQERHEILMEAFKDDSSLQKNMLLETVGKEVQDAATLAIETLRQMTPTNLFPPSIAREQLTPCTLPIPTTSILGLFTTMRHLQYISRNMQRLSRVMFTEYVQGIVEKTSPHYHRGENKFDVGEFVQSLGDLVSADASLKGIEFVIYHSQYDLNHVSIKGSEESWRHALINLIKSIIDCAKAGSTVELCLALFTLPDSEKEKNKVTVSFEITYYPGSKSLSTEDDLAQLNALLASKLVRAMGGSLEIEQLENRVKRFVVSVDVERSQTPQEEKTGIQRNTDDQGRTVHPLEGSKTDDASQTAITQENQKVESTQTSHPINEFQQYFQQHIRTPAVSPSPIPSSPPPPRRIGSMSNPKISAEPTIPELLRFSRKLAGLKVVLIAKENSAFATRLTGYLKHWGISVAQKTIDDDTSALAETDSTSSETQTTSGGAKRSNSTSSLSSKFAGFSTKPESPSSAAKLLNPAFIMIDDDARILGQQILKMQSNPPSPAVNTTAPKRPTHRRHKSITSIQHTSIIYFTSLPTFKQARDTITFILGTQTPGINYNIGNSLSGNTLANGSSSSLPYILVLPKPAGPRRVLTAIHTAINVPVLDHSYSPIATAPTSPAPAIRHFSEEINPLDRDQIVYDPVSNQAFAKTVPSSSTQSSPGGLSPNGMPQEQRQRRDMMRQLIDAGGSMGQVAYPFGSAIAESMSPETPGSVMGSPTGILIPGSAGQPAGIQFDPTAKPVGTPSPSLPGAAHRRISAGSGRHLTQSLSSSEGAIVIPPNLNAINHQPFALMHAQRSSESGTPNSFIRLTGGHLRPAMGRSPLSTPPPITHSNGLLFSPPTSRHSGMASPLPQRPEPAAMRSNSGSLSSLGADSPKMNHPVLPHGSLSSSSSLPTSPGALTRVSPGSSGAASTHVTSPPLVDSVPGRTATASTIRDIHSVKKSKASKATPSMIKSGVVERVSPLVNVLIVEDNLINLQILTKFMSQRKIKFETARNGKEAVEKWRVGGFHLVLMDIQMPVMDGIEATREIRRLEKAQKIGVFPTDKPNSVDNSMAFSATSPTSATIPSSQSSTSTNSTPSSPPASPFRSPVIIVALTATAESEDLRKTALLAGCNDYITKPVEFPWLERKIVDWGCMQALIDVDAWKEWKRNLEGTSPGSPSAGPSIGASSTLRKTMSISGNTTITNLKRPSISARSIKGMKAAAAAAAAAKSAEAAAAAAMAEKVKQDDKTTTTSAVEDLSSLSTSEVVKETEKEKEKEEAVPSHRSRVQVLSTIPETT
ncbi:ssk1 response regulator receiver, partial [Entomortierella lignicola]